MHACRCARHLVASCTGGGGAPAGLGRPAHSRVPRCPPSTARAGWMRHTCARAVCRPRRVATSPAACSVHVGMHMAWTCSMRGQASQPDIQRACGGRRTYSARRNLQQPNYLLTYRPYYLLTNLLLTCLHAHTGAADTADTRIQAGGHAHTGGQTRAHLLTYL